MSKLGTLLTGTLLVTSAAYIAAPATAAPTTTHTGANTKACEAAVLPGPDGVDDKNWAVAVDSTGTYTAGGTEPQNGNEIPLLWKGDKLEAAIEIPDPQDPMARDVNAKGQVILDDFAPDDKGKRVFVYADGKVAQLDQRGAIHAEVNKIADDGTIVGSIATSPKEYVPVTWDANNPTAKPRQLELADDKPSGAAYEIDEAGNIAGTHYTPDPDPGPSGIYLWKNGEGTPTQLPLPESDGASIGVSPIAYDQGWALALGVPGDIPTYYLYAPGEKPVEYAHLGKPTDVTAKGWVTGNKTDGRSTSALVSPEGEITDLPLPDGMPSSGAFSISADGSVIVGTAVGPDPDAFVSSAVKWTCQ